jgi:predicted Zn finger-like uncharacterized protein
LKEQEKTKGKTMKAECPNCGTAYRVVDSKIPENGAYVLCKKCPARFFVGADRRSSKDRRSGADRRKAYYSITEDSAYFSKGGSERRGWSERRSEDERRKEWLRVDDWSSVLWGELLEDN